MVGALLVLGSYLIGSIPTAYILGRVLKGIDIRSVGDGNVGAANAFREIGPVTGLSVLGLDACKGAVAVIITQAFASQLVVFLAGFAVVVGHNWPIFLRFRGGRGEATAIGVLSAILPLAMLILLGIAAVPFVVTRNTVLVGIILFAPLWLVALPLGATSPVIAYSIGLPCMVGATHLIKSRRLPAELKHVGKYMRRTRHP